jgi:GNAT superfamily N-acetyltransferase
MEMARMCFFDDRFSLDRRISSALARKRFESVISNGLGGLIADFVLTAYLEMRPIGVIFFGVNGAMPPRAGKWLTVLIHPEMREQGLGEVLVAKAIEMLPGGLAHWSYKCALQNLPSFEASRRLGFRLGAVAHDLHFWKDR